MLRRTNFPALRTYRSVRTSCVYATERGLEYARREPTHPPKGGPQGARGGCHLDRRPLLDLITADAFLTPARTGDAPTRIPQRPQDPG